MIGMVYKDFLVLRKQLSYYLVFFIVYTALVVAGVFDASILSALVVLMGMMLPMSAVGFDDQAHWEKYAVSTPAGRRGVVAGKYLFCIISILVTAGAVLVLTLLISLAGFIPGTLLDFCVSLLACAGITLVLDAIILPLLLKFGAEKSRVITMLIFVVVFGGSMALGLLSDESVSLPSPPAWLLSALPVALALVSVGGFLISYFVACGIYEKKEF